MRLVTVGVGAAASPRYAPAGLLVARRGVRVMLDGGPGAEPAGRLDAWLVTDERAELSSQLRRLAAQRGLRPHAGSFLRGELRIDVHPVVHTSHSTFGYQIQAPEGTVVWAPEFFEFPHWADGTGLLFAEAAGWERPIRFAGGIGGHLHVPAVAEAPAATGSAGWCSPTSAGPPSGRSTGGSGPPSGSSPGTARCSGSRAGDSRPRRRGREHGMANKQDPLGAYRGKRDLTRTPEPSAGRKRRGRGRPRFVVHQHDATTLHYDFRLEAAGVLKSWAVPKGPSTNPRDKRLAMPTEDHPLDYVDFEGLIPKGQYGAGPVIVWDAGTYRSLTEEDGKPVPVERAVQDGHVAVWLEGRKLTGGYALTRIGKGKRERWLLVKMADEEADDRRKPVKSQPESVVSGRTVEEVAAEAEAGEGRRG